MKHVRCQRHQSRKKERDREREREKMIRWLFIQCHHQSIISTWSMQKYTRGVKHDTPRPLHSFIRKRSFSEDFKNADAMEKQNELEYTQIHTKGAALWAIHAGNESCSHPKTSSVPTHLSVCLPDRRPEPLGRIDFLSLWKRNWDSVCTRPARFFFFVSQQT